MFQRKSFDVLVVDDDPDVLAVTRLCLKNTRYAGVPLRLTECSGRDPAMELLQNTAVLPDFAVGIIDVVMETDTAGLELCEYIRQTQRNHLTQLVIRTGQAGKYPERTIIDTYDVSGYLSKVDATETRLYSAVKTAVRQYDWAWNALFFYQLYGALILGFRSPPDLYRVLQGFMNQINRGADPKRPSPVEAHMAFQLGETRIAVGEMADENQYNIAVSHAMESECLVLNSNDDTYRESVRADGTADVLLTLGGGGAGMPRVQLAARCTSGQERYVVLMWQKLLHSVRRLLTVSDFVDNLLVESRLDKVWPG